MRKHFDSLLTDIRGKQGGMWLMMALIFLVANHFTLLVGDDIFYRFICGSVDHGAPERLTSLQDLWTSFWGHFEVMNGRSFLNVFLLQSALNLIPIWLFNVLNTLVWMGLTYVMAKQVHGQKSLGTVLVMTSAVFVVLCPIPYETLLWKAGVVNYLWSALALMMTLSVYVQEKPSFWVTCLLSLWLGVMHEGFCVPFIAFAALDALGRRSFKRMAFAGFVVLGFSLQFFNETSGRDEQSVLSLFTDFGLWRVFDILETLTSSIAFMLLALCMVVWFIRNWRAAWAYVKKRYQYFVLLVLYMGMLVVIGHISGPRKFMPVHVLSVLLLVDLYVGHVKWRIGSRAWTGVFLVYAALFGVNTVWPNYLKTKEEIEVIQSSEDAIVMAAVSPVRIFDDQDFEDFYTNYALYYRVPVEKVYNLSEHTYPLIRYALPETLYKGVYKTDDFCVAEHEVQPGVFVFRDVHVAYNKKQYVIIRCEEDSIVDTGLAVHFVHEDYGWANRLVAKLRKPKTVPVDRSKMAVIRSVYGVKYVICDVGWPKFYKVAGVSK